MQFSLLVRAGPLFAACRFSIMEHALRGYQFIIYLIIANTLHAANIISSAEAANSIINTWIDRRSLTDSQITGRHTKAVMAHFYSCIADKHVAISYQSASNRLGV